MSKLAVVLVALGSAGAVQATPITYDFQGSFLHDFGTISLGTTVSGYFSYDTDASGDVNEDYAFYPYISAAFTIGSNTYSSDGLSGLRITIRDGTYGRDDFQLELDRNIVIGGINLQFYTPVHIVLHDFDSTIFDSLALPSVLPDLSEYEFPRLGASATAQSIAQNGVGDRFRVSITSLQPRPVSVPEPGTLALFGLGLFGMALARRRKQLA